MKNKLLFLSVVVAFLFSCKNDLDLLAPYKDVPIIYGILNQDTAVKAQYIRINKAFLGPGNALDMAKVYDSINYPTGTLDVKIERIKNGNTIATYTLVPDSSILKSSGSFSAPKQVLYRLDATLNEDSEYKLIVKNTKTGQEYTAQTALVHKINITKPNQSTSPNFAAGSALKSEWQSSKNGKSFQLSVRFHYTETKNSTASLKYIDIDFDIQTVVSINSYVNMVTSIPPETFYKFLAGHLVADPNITRVAGPVDFIVTGASEDLTTYIQNNQIPTGIVQEKQNYTNIKGGAFGIFGARINSGVYGLTMSATALDSLKMGQFTKNLGF